MACGPGSGIPRGLAVPADVYVAGAAMTRFAKQPDRSLKSLVAEAALGAVRAAGVEVADLEAVYFGNAVAGSITGQEMVLAQVSLRPLGIVGIPVVNVENACASSSTALHLGWQAVAGGLADVVLVVGAEKMSHPDRSRAFEAIGRAVDVEAHPLSGAGDRSPLMDVYAREACDYMEASGAGVRDLAAVAVKNQLHGSLNPLAQYGSRLTAEDVLGSREIVAPLTLLMCSPITDGAAAAVLVSRKRAGPRRVRIAASVLRSGVPPGSGAKAPTLAARAAYEAAGVGPEDLDCAELHDAAAPAELILYEQLGFAGAAEGASLIRDGHTALGGRLPVNTSGGLLARGHPIGATGLGQVVEAVQQLRGEAGARQVDGATVALAENGGGWLDGDNAAAAVHILIRE